MVLRLAKQSQLNRILFLTGLVRTYIFLTSMCYRRYRTNRAKGEYMNKKYIKKLLTKIFVFAISLLVILSIISSLSPITNNYFYLNQMDNTSFSFVLLQLYNKIVDWYPLGIILIGLLIFKKDIYKLFAFLKGEEKNEEV